MELEAAARRRRSAMIDQRRAGLQGDSPVGFGIMKYRDDEAHCYCWRWRWAGPAGDRQQAGGMARSSSARGRNGQVYLEARFANAIGRAFYRRLGYAEIQTVPGYYAGVEASIRMAKDLWIEQPASA